MNARALFGRVRRGIALCAVLSLAPAFASPALAAWPSDPAVGLPVCTAAVSPANLAVAPDGAGGAYFAWRETRAGNWDLYAQHVRSDGVVATGWPEAGIAVCSRTSSVGALEIVADGRGGAVIVWVDYREANGDIYAHHLLEGGLDPAWPANGLAVSAVPMSSQYSPKVVGDGAGGAVAAWLDGRAGNTDVYAQRVLAEGAVDPAWPPNGLALCTDLASQSQVQLTSDGAGGAIVAWADMRNTLDNDLYAARVLASGVADPFWPANGRLVAGGTGNQYAHTLAPDGSGGAVIGWLDTRAGNEDIYVHRISRSGVLSPAWPANGRAVASRTAAENDVRLACDGSGNSIVVFRAADTVNGGYDLFAAHVLSNGSLGTAGSWYSSTYGSGYVGIKTGTGTASSCKVVADHHGNALIAWNDNRSGTYDLYAHWLAVDGSFAPGWPADGLAFCTATGNQYTPGLGADGTGGLLVSWEDAAAGSGGLFCRRITRFATFAGPEPVIRGVVDVANDQGGKVHVLWTAALGDGGGHETIRRYTLWRRSAAEAWEFLADVPARAAPGYAFMASTFGDSSWAGTPWTTFRVLAHDSSYGAVLASPPDSGYSRDDLVPAAPAGFTVTRDGERTRLRWSAAADAGHSHYRLYRGSSPAFTADASHLVAELEQTSFEDATPPPCWYRLSAVDVHGNEGPTALAAVGPLAGASYGQGWPYHPLVNLPVTLEGQGQYGACIVPDGYGGAIAFYIHFPTGAGSGDLHAQHLLESGRVDDNWPPAGVPVCVSANDQTSPRAVEASGGAVVTWEDLRNGADYDIYASRLLMSGLTAPGWAANGLAMCTAAGHQRDPLIVRSVSGGAIVLWNDERAGSSNADVYAQRVTDTGSVAWAANGVAVAAGAGSQGLGDAASDDAGGAYVAWRDGATGAVYVHHLLASGTSDPAWPAGGRQVSANAQYPQLVANSGGVIVLTLDVATALTARRITSAGAFDPAWPPGGVSLVSASSVWARAVPDGSNGALIGWTTYPATLQFRIAAQHVTWAGALAAGWPSGGVTLREGQGWADAPHLVLSGDGEPLLTWYESQLAADYDVYAQRVVSTGVVDPAWPAGGRAVCLALKRQWLTGVCVDGAGGSIAVWDDERDGSTRVYAQRVEATGALGHPEPAITSVVDIPHDQGGAVRVSWRPSLGEYPPFHGITEYTLWRRLTIDGAAAARARGAATFEARAGEAPRPGMLRQVATPSGSTWWEYVAAVPALGLDSYAVSVPTTADSLPGEVFWNVFFVDAQDTSFAMNLFYPSAPDSGYSADNLAPRLPTPCLGFYANGTTSLHWQVATEPDFANYRIYRGTTRDFPGPAGLVATLTDTGYVDVAGQPFYYFIQSWDAHGNASPNGFIEPAGVLETPPGAPPVALALGSAHPNPSHDAITIPLALPRPARVTLTVLDVAGRRVRTLADGPLPAGEHAFRWDGADERGAPRASGLYFVRLEAEGRTLHSRIVRTR